MKITTSIYKTHKVVPLRISHEEESSTQMAVLKFTHDSISGFGEIIEFSFSGIDNSWKCLSSWLPELKHLEHFSPFHRLQIEQKLIEMKAPMAIRAGVDMAIHDWLGKKSGLPLNDMLGLRGLPLPQMSLTIGIDTPKNAVKRMEKWLKLGPTHLWKIKLGNPLGLDADKDMFKSLAQKIQPTGANIYVDANGGWTQEQAFHMAKWLQEYDVLFIEQPLPRGEEVKLAELTESSALPIFADESCLHSEDMQDLVTGGKAGCHGINIKLSKCGGISEAMRMITLARHHNLQVMLGCYSNTILGNTAAAHISSLVDYVDLDSHLNLKDDPCHGGAHWHNGKLFPNKLPGLGITFDESKAAESS